MAYSSSCAKCSVKISGNYRLLDWNVDLRANFHDISQFFLTTFEYMGSLGNAVFITISSWFLLESDKVNKKKIIQLIIETWIISVIVMGIYLIFGGRLNATEIIKQLFPVTFGLNWFIITYILFFAMHPLLNIIITSITKVQLLKINCVLILLYCCINFVLWRTFCWNGLIGFIVIYFITAYVKLYLADFSNNLRRNCILLFWGCLGFGLLLVVTNILGLLFPPLSNKMLHWTTFNNPFFIMIGIALVLIGKNLPEKHTVLINKLAAACMFIYLLHENYILRTYIRPSVMERIVLYYGHTYDVAIILIMALIQFIACILIYEFYTVILSKFIVKLSGALEKKISVLSGKVISFLVRFQ